MKRTKCLLSLLLAAVLLVGFIPTAVAAPPSGPNVINVADYNADSTGMQDACEAVKNALAAAKNLPASENKTVYFPKGEYHFYADYAQKRELYISNTLGLNQNYKVKSIGILLEDMKNVTIDGGGSMFIYHGDITSFAAIRCENITFTNFSFDHASPSVVDMTVESKVEGENAVIFSVPAHYNYTINGTNIQWQGEVGPVTGTPYWQGNGNLQHGQIYDTLSGKCWSSGGPFNNVTGITDLGEGRLKFSYSNPGSVPPVGYSYQRRNTTRTTAAVLIWESTGVKMKNINAHYLHGFGIVGQLSKNITLENVSFRARPESGRTTASFADFVQMSSVGGKVTIKDCDFSAAHDDPINIHGTFLTVESVSGDGKTLTVKYRHNETAGFPQFYVGDTVDFSTKGTMVPLADSTRTIAAVTDDGWGKDTMTIVLDRAVRGLTGGAQFVIENVTYTPEVEITGCRFTSIPTRGILVTTRKPVLIENNLFDAMKMASIFISCDAQGWYESGHTEDVTIRNNIFLRPGSECILVGPTGSNDRNHQLHTNMTIEDNTFFLESSVQVVNAKSVKNLTIRNNSVMRYQPDVTLTLTGNQSIGVGATTQLNADIRGASLDSQLYRFENCKDVTLENNLYDGGLNQKIELTAGTQSSDLSIIDDDSVIGADNKTDPLGKVFYWSSNPAVLTVNERGEATGVSTGNAEVRVIAVTGTSSFISEPLSIEVTGVGTVPTTDTIKVTAGKYLLDKGERTQMTAEPADDVTWSVSDNAVAEIDTMGRLTAKTGGVVEVLATNSSGASGSTLVAVRKILGERSDDWMVQDNANNWSINGEKDELTINAARGGDWASGTGAKSIFLTTPGNRERFTAVVKLHNKTKADWEEAGLIVFKDHNNYVALERKHNNGNPKLAVTSEKNASPGEEPRRDDISNNVLWLKLVKDNNTFTGYYSEDGQNWTEIRSVVNDALGDAKVGVIACNSEKSTPFTFSDFTLDGQRVPFAKGAQSPSIKNAVVTANGSTAELTYDFERVGNTAEGTSVIRWYASASETGAGRRLDGATGKILPLDAGLVDQYVWAMIAPVDALGRTGSPVISPRIKVTAFDYDASDATLRLLELGAALMPGFDPNTETYSAVIPGSVSELAVLATPTNPNSNVKLMLDGAEASSPLALTQKDHTITVTVTSPNNNTKTYTVNLRTAEDSRAWLSDLTLGELAFRQEQNFYHLLCGKEVSELPLSVTAAPGCTLTVRYRNAVMEDGENSVENLLLPVSGGLNDLEITVTAPDGKAITLYRVSLVKHASRDASLSSLKVDGNTVPDFAPDKTEYRIDVDGEVALIEAVANGSGMVTMTADGKLITDGRVVLNNALTEVIVRVTAEDGVNTRDYKLQLLKAQDDNAALLNVTLGNTGMAFDPAQENYTLTLYRNQLVVTAEAMERNATIQLDTQLQQARGIGSVTKTFNLKAGVNTLTAMVTAPDGVTTKTYTWTISVEDSIYLSDLDWQTATAGDSTWNGGKPGKDIAWEGKPMAVPNEAGEAETFAKGVGTHANSEIVYDLSDGDYKNLSAKIGVSYHKYNHNDDPRLIFIVKGDGNELYRSPEISSTTPYIPIDVPIEGVQTLTLQVITNKGNIWSAHGNWADAKLITSLYALAVEAPAFDPVTVGYTQPEAKALIIRSEGNSNATITSVELSGANANLFNLNKTDGITIPAGSTDNTTYTVQPAADLPAGRYTATVTVTYNGDATATADVTFSVAPAKPDEGVGYTIDYATETITVEDGYDVNTAEDFNNETAVSTGSTVTPGSTLYIRLKETASTPAGAAATISVPQRPDTPTVQGVNETVAGRKDGKITGLTAGENYQISSDNGQSWSDKTANAAGEITDLASGTYQVRVKATGNSFASLPTAVEIATGDKPTYTLNVTAPAFDAVTSGYRQPDAKALTITSSGNSDATITSVTVSGDKFLIGGSGDTVSAGKSISTWTIRPKAGLGAGTHTATITVTYNGGATATAEVSFTVKSPDEPGYTSYTLTFVTNGGSAINSVTAREGTVINLNDYTPVRNSYRFDGWYSDSKLKNRVYSVTMNGDMTVYAKWVWQGPISPTTGDDSNLALWLILLAFSGASVIGTAVWSRKRKSKR